MKSASGHASMRLQVRPPRQTLQTAQAEQKKPERERAVGHAQRNVEHAGRRRVAGDGLLNSEPGDIEAVESDEYPGRRVEHVSHPWRKERSQQIDPDMLAAPHHLRRADENHDGEGDAGHLLDPGRRIAASHIGKARPTRSPRPARQRRGSSRRARARGSSPGLRRPRLARSFRQKTLHGRLDARGEAGIAIVDRRCRAAERVLVHIVDRS